MPPRASPRRLTHFLCIPLVTHTSRPQLQKSLTAFKERIARIRTTELPDGVPEKAVRPLGTLHLTLGVMSLLTPEQVENALTVLRDLNIRELLSGVTSHSAASLSNQTGSRVKGKGKDKNSTQGSPSVDNPAPLTITLRGLTSMHTPRKTSILYTSPVDPDARLYSFCQRLRAVFTAAGLLVADASPLLLHATIVNTVYVSGVRGKGSGHSESRAKLTLDARELLEDHEDFEWMSDVKVERVAICRMGAKKGQDGEEKYQVEGEINVL